MKYVEFALYLEVLEHGEKSHLSMYNAVRIVI
jgi:hypothetical protein